MSLPAAVQASMPGFFRSSWLVAAKDLRMEWKTFERLASMGESDASGSLIRFLETCDISSQTLGLDRILGRNESQQAHPPLASVVQHLIVG